MEVKFNFDYTKTIDNFFYKNIKKKFFGYFFYSFLKKIYSFLFSLLKKVNRKVNRKEILINNLKREVYFQKKEIEIHQTDLAYLVKQLHLNNKNNFEVITEFPVATDSPDHLFPTGTIIDNTRSIKFFENINLFFKKKINHMDLGCAGGGLVFDSIKNGNESIGIEGSDISKKTQRAFWGVIPKNLFTADATKKFTVLKNNALCQFDVITAFEFLEHIKGSDLDSVFLNIDKHLAPKGYFIGSIGTKPSFSANMVPLHQTVWEVEKWLDFIKKYFKLSDDIKFNFIDFPRGTGNTYEDPNFYYNPIGFHFQCKKKL